MAEYVLGIAAWIMNIERFHQIFSLEVEAILKRREKYKRPRIVLEKDDHSLMARRS